MALLIPEPPLASRQGLQEGLRRLSTSNKSTTLWDSVGEVPAPNASHPQQMFTITLDDLAPQATLDSAKGTAWRYLLSHAPNSGDAAMAAVDVNKVGDQHSFAQMHRGWLPEETKKTIEIAQALPKVQQGKYELRAIRVPSLLVDALWLKDTEGTDDLIVPIRSVAPGLNSGTAYSAAAFMDNLRAIAARKPKFDDRPLRS